MIRPFDLNIRHLRALAAIEEHGSMSAAALAVSLSQPALTQGLAKLEAQLGIALFDRRPDGMAATPAGRQVAERALAAFAHLALAVRTVRRAGARGFARPELLMTSTQLNAFLAFADAGSFVGASLATGISGPSLHRAVRELEQLCQAPLAQRRGRGVALTDAGRRLARGIRLAAVELGAAIDETATGTAPGGGGRITVGAMPLCRALLLPAAIAALTRAAPHATVDVVEGSWRELVEPLRDGHLDLMVGALRSPVPADLAQQPLFEDELVVIAGAHHPLARRSTVSVEELGHHPWIVSQAGTPLRARWEALFGGGPLPPAPVECGSVMVARGVLRETDYLTLVSPDQVALEIAGGVLATVGAPLADTRRTIGITTRADWRPTTLQSRFAEFLGTLSPQRTIPVSE